MAIGVGETRRRRGARREGLRRPAAEVEGPPWNLGREVNLGDVSVEELEVTSKLIITEGYYFAAPVKVAGEVQRVELAGGQRHLWMRVTGTDSEELLKIATLNPKEPFCVHLCPLGCGLHESGERYLHGKKGKKVVDFVLEDAWTTNLTSAGAVVEAPRDELEELRRRGEGVEPLKEKPKNEENKKRPRPSSSRSSVAEAKKSKRRKKKKKKGAEDEEKVVDDGRHPVRSSQKEVKALFAGTGLDSREKIRKRVTKRAKQYIRRKGRKKDSSSSSSSKTTSSSLEAEEEQVEGLFSESSKAKGISERFPGTLCYQSMMAMKEGLLTEAGEDLEKGLQRPVAMLYYRAHLQRKASGAANREVLTLCSSLDHLLRGRAAQCADILSQRLKSVEASLNGSHWAIAQRMEVPGVDQYSIAQRTELENAQKESYLESKTRYLAAGPGAKDGEKGKGKGGKKGDPKGGHGGYGKDGKHGKENPRGDHKEKKKDAEK